MRPALCVLVLLLGCQRDRSTHTRSDSLPTLAARQELLERYVTFRRHYTTLDFDLEYQDDPGLGLGPSTMGCDIRVHATVPASELATWSDGLAAWAGPANPSWLATVPNAPTSLDGFTWWRGNTRDSREVAISATTSEVLYWNVCARN